MDKIQQAYATGFMLGVGFTMLLFWYFSTHTIIPVGVW